LARQQPLHCGISIRPMSALGYSRQTNTPDLPLRIHARSTLPGLYCGCKRHNLIATTKEKNGSFATISVPASCWMSDLAPIATGLMHCS